MNPVIILWAHPRSMSTAIERVMRERGDFECLHEPFLHYYYLDKTGKALPHFASEAGHPTSYAATREWILECAEAGPVFAKDMSYYVMPELLDDVDFCRRVRHCFLIRDPLRAILSYYRLDPAVAPGEIGIEAQWRQFEGLRELGIDNSLVLEAEAVQRDPAGMIGRFWRSLGLDYLGDALSWRRGEIPDDWQYVEGWHQSVRDSAGIHAPDDDAARAGEAFAAAAEEAPQLRDYLEHHRPFYQRLQRHSLSRNTSDA